jgi:amidase
VEVTAMRTPVRRFLVFTTLVALLIGAVGISAPVALGAQPLSTRVAGINVDATTIPQLQALMYRHRLTSVQLVQFYLHRIRDLNPKLHAVITVNPRALALARAADKARRFGDRRPLLGIPVLVKDNVNTTGMPTTGGSWALAGSTPSDAFIVQRLKAAGAIVIAKANLSEWANFRSNPSSSGWSGIGGQTNMPYVLDRNPCGSSSGTGSGIAADLATVGVGTETDGSIVCPAGANGIVGLKPTIGLWSRAGVIPISADQDTAGPMTRNVTDAAVVLGAATGIDPNDPATAAQAGHVSADYTRFLDAHALEGKRIGIWRIGTYSDEPILADVIDVLKSQGATVVDPTDIDLSAAFANEFPALLCEFKTDIATYLQTYTAAGYPKTLADLIAFNKTHTELEGPWNNGLWEDAEKTGGRSDPACQAARAATTAPTQAAVDGLMAANDLDAIVGLTNGPAWVTSADPKRGDLEGTKDFSLFIGNSTASAVAGYATITVPATYVGHLPINISFIGGRWSEPEMIAFGFDYEQATHARVPPTFLAHETASAAAALKGPAIHESKKSAVAGREMRGRMLGR